MTFVSDGLLDCLSEVVGTDGEEGAGGFGIATTTEAGMGGFGGVGIGLVCAEAVISVIVRAPEFETGMEANEDPVPPRSVVPARPESIAGPAATPLLNSMIAGITFTCSFVLSNSI